MAIIYASENNNYTLVKYLIEKGADIHKNNDMPIRYATKNNNYTLVPPAYEFQKNNPNMLILETATDPSGSELRLGYNAHPVF